MNSHALHAPAPVVSHAALMPRPSVMARDFAYLLVALPAGIVTFTWVVTGLSLGAGLMVVALLGIPITLATLVVNRWLGDVERRRAGWVLERAPEPLGTPWRGGLWPRFKATVSDPSAWADALRSLVMLPAGTAGFTVSVSLWATALGMASSPAWYWATSENDDTIALLDDRGLGWTALRVLIGVVLIPVAAWASRGMAVATARLWGSPAA